MKTIVNYNLSSIEIDHNKECNSDDLIKLIEDTIKINKFFFEIKYDESEIELNWKYKSFNENLINFYYNNCEYLIPQNIILESKVIKVVTCDNEKGDNPIFDDNKIEFTNKKLNKIDYVFTWILLSSEINLFLDSKGSDLNIPRPLTNSKISKFIGEKAYEYLESLSLEVIEDFTIFCDYLDISYLLEVLCAFIAEKFVKNKSIEEIKNIFNDI